MADPHIPDYREIAHPDPEVLDLLLSRKINIEFDIHCLIEGGERGQTQPTEIRVVALQAGKIPLQWAVRPDIPGIHLHNSANLDLQGLFRAFQSQLVFPVDMEPRNVKINLPQVPLQKPGGIRVGPRGQGHPCQGQKPQHRCKDNKAPDNMLKIGKHLKNP